jgi:integrase
MSIKVWNDVKGTALRLRWNYQGKRYQLSLGVQNNNTGKAYAQIIAGQITRDIECDNFDLTLKRYQNKHKRNRKPKLEELNKLTAVALFEQYAVVMIRDKNLAPGSIDRYKAISSKLRECLGAKLAHQVNDSIAKSVVMGMNQTIKGETVKTYLLLLRACWNWARDKYHLAEINPWSDCLKLVTVEPRIPDKPFTIAELQAIVKGFINHPQYYYYAEFVLFLSHTACRFGEAAGLRWKHLGTDFSTAWIGESISRGHQKGTKNGKARIIQLSPTLRTILLQRYEQVNPTQIDLVFPSPKGLAIDDHNFRPRAWKKVLSSWKIEYRKPYNLRHSAISHALAAGANPIELAKQTGHDVRVMFSTYAHVITDFV